MKPIGTIFVTFMMISLVFINLTESKFSSGNSLIKLDDTKHDSALRYKNLRTHEAATHNQVSLMSFIQSRTIVAKIILYLVGPFIFMLAFTSIWVNQRKVFIDSRRLDLAQQICHKVNPEDKNKVNAELEQLVFSSGNSTANNLLRDPLSGISKEEALKLTRIVQVMEWRIQLSRNCTKTKKAFVLDWCSNHEPKVEQKTNRPQFWFIKKQIFYNTSAYLGQFHLGKKQLDSCTKTQKIVLTQANVDRVMKKLPKKYQNRIPTLVNDYIYFPSPLNNQLEGEGALRIKYEYCPVGPLTVVAKNVGNAFDSFDIEQYEIRKLHIRDDCQGCTAFSSARLTHLKLQPIQYINCLYEDILSVKAVFFMESAKLVKQKFLYRGVTFLMILAGSIVMFSPLIDFLGCIPYLGDLLKVSSFWVNLITTIFASIPFWILVSCIAWTWYRPKFKIVFIVIGILIVVGIIVLWRLHAIRAAQQQQNYETAKTIQHLFNS